MDEEAVLVYSIAHKDDDGFPEKEHCEIPIWVHEKSATRTEFYDALRAGIKVKTVFEARIEDFELSAHDVDGKKQYADQIMFDGNVYDIVRTYKKDKSKIEITCS